MSKKKELKPFIVKRVGTTSIEAYTMKEAKEKAKSIPHVVFDWKPAEVMQGYLVPEPTYSQSDL